MSCPKKTEIITISDSEEDEIEYATPKRKADLFPFVPLKRINLIQTPFFKGGVNDCASESRHHEESNSQESSKKCFEKIVLEKATLQKQLNESKKKVGKLEEENILIYQKLSDASSIIESQKSLILKLKKDLEDNRSTGVKWESKFIKMKQSMLEVSSSLRDLVESCIKDGSSQFCEHYLNKKEYNPGPNAPYTPNMPNTESQGQNFTPRSGDKTLTNEHMEQLNSPDKKFKCDICKLVKYQHMYLLNRHMRVKHGVKSLKRTNSGCTGESKDILMAHQQTECKTGPRMTKIVAKLKKSAQIDNKDVRQPDPLNFPEVQSVKGEDSLKLETESKDNQLIRALPRRARKTPLRYEEEFNTDFSIKRPPKPTKCDKTPIPRWPVSKHHGIGDCKHGFMCVCGREFKSKTDLWNHIKPYIQGHPFSCFICGDGFNELEKAHRHVQQVHRRH